MSDTSAQLPGKAVPAKEKKPEKEIPAFRLASVILFAAAFSALAVLLLLWAGILSASRELLAGILISACILFLCAALFCLFLMQRKKEAAREQRDEEKNVERLSTELELAKNIQNNMLPSIYPAFPERKEFDVYARTEPAKELGGDFFDFQMIDREHLALIIADVAGKGIPAAMFMMASKIIIANLAKNRSHDPARILKAVNKQIGANNQSDMFVTLWLGILDLSTGLLSAANAGHEYPCLKHKEQPFRLLKDPHGLVLGVMDKTEYRSYDIQLVPGDTLFLYTDGVTEAVNAEMTEFGTERMVEALNRNPEATVAQLVDHVRDSITSFTGDTPQADDITMMALRYFGEEGKPGQAEETDPDQQPAQSDPSIVKTEA